MGYPNHSEMVVMAEQGSAGVEAETKTRRAHKTKFCMYHLQGVCQYGNKCAFAHSIEELQAPDVSNDEPGSSSDDESRASRSEEEKPRTVNAHYKKTLCMWHAKGWCRNEEKCSFAHGVEELRPRDPQEASSPAASDREFKGSRVQHRNVCYNGTPQTLRAAPGLSLPNNKTGPIGKLPLKLDEPMFVRPLSPMSAATTASSEPMSPLSPMPRRSFSPRVMAYGTPVSSPPGLAVPPGLGLTYPACDGNDMDSKHVALNIDARAMQARFLEMHMYEAQRAVGKESEMLAQQGRRLDLSTLLGA